MAGDVVRTPDEATEGLPGDDRAALVAGGAEGVAEADAFALGGLFEGRLQGFLVDGFRGGVADDVEAAAARAGARGGGAVVAAAARNEDGEQKYEKGGQCFPGQEQFLSFLTDLVF